MGERDDIIKTMHRELAARNAERAHADYAIYDPSDPSAGQLVGRVSARGFADEIDERFYLVVDGVDGRTHYVDIGRADAVDPTSEGAIVAIAPKRAEARQVDRTVAWVAAANDGRYSVDIHLKHNSSATAAFARAASAGSKGCGVRASGWHASRMGPGSSTQTMSSTPPRSSGARPSSRP